MASAVSDDSSDVAPSEFPLSSSEDDLLEKNEASNKCPLCRNTRKYFYCADCIRNGDFFHSRCVQRESSQRFIEKKMAFLRVKGKIQELLIEIETKSANERKLQTMQQQMRDCQERIRVLRKWKSQVEESIANSLSKLEEMKKTKEASYENITMLKSDSSTRSMLTVETKLKMASLKSELEDYSQELRKVIRENVKILLEVIFPITYEGVATVEEESESLVKVKGDLADASHTNYIGRNWVYSDMGENGRYRIAGALLPGTGDKEAYALCVSQSGKDGNTETLSHFKVAMSYIAQLCRLLAFYLGVNLPKRVSHMDFVRNDLDHKRLTNRITRVNTNVLFLCTSQRIAPIHLRTVNPLARLLTLLDKNVCDLGRNEAFEFPPEMWPIQDANEEDGGAGSSSSTSDEESDSLNADWESVTHPHPIDGASGVELHNSRPSSTGPNRENPLPSSTVVSGVVTSLWRAWPWSTK